jgi:hypothetical protein
VLEAVDPRLLELRVVRLLVNIGALHRLGVLEQAAAAVGRRHEARETAADGAFATQAGDIGHARDRSAVLAFGRVGGERYRAATT